MKNRVLSILLTLFITLFSFGQRKGTFDNLQVKKTVVGTVGDSLLVRDNKGEVKHLLQSTLLDRAEVQIQSKIDLKADLTDLNSHVLNTNNPHNVTKVQVGLSNVDNTSDANKPISTATQSALDTKFDKSNLVTDFSILNNTKAPTVQAVQNELSNYVNNSQKAVPNGVATLEVDGKIPMSQIPDALVGSVSYQGNYNASTNTPSLSNPTNSTTKGYYYVVNVVGTQFGQSFNLGDWIISNGSEWQKVDNNNDVTSVYGRKGAILALEGDYQSYYPRLSFNYNDPSWISSLDYGKLINKPTTLSGYGITDVYTKTESDGIYARLNIGNTFTESQSIEKASATLLTLKRLGSNANIGIRLQGDTVDKYVGLGYSGELKFGATADLSNQGDLIYHEGNFVAGTDYLAPNGDGSQLTGITASLPAGFYEEGTFTPTLVDQSGSATYSSNIEANFVRTGNLVSVHILFHSINTTGTPTGYLLISNFPFPTTGNGQSFSISNFRNSTLTSTQLSTLGGAMYSTGISFRDLDSGSPYAVSFTAGRLEISGTYKTNVYTP